ncbi:MAG: phage major capsid protein family [Amycolatopsis sp.]|jgi:HK97 family phage major capsid protein|uniref:phage major capsid protein n=1 Tax=Amycolatopsis sp. TaxID=37632 RepID=UPI002616D8EB|nr:phage major capsid protein [Amycolatopsis sp.]MCU1687769.1 phage major capsid protein family [Amycolatopsis sp.]
MTATLALSPGQRDRLVRNGIDPIRLRRVVNTAAAPPIPKNAVELEEMIHDSAKLKPVLANKDAFKQFVLDYAKEAQGDGTDLHRLVADETQKQLANYLRDNEVDDVAGAVKRLNLDPQTRPAGMLSSHKQATAYNPKAVGVALDTSFTSAADYFHNAWHLNPSSEARAKMETIRNSYSSVVPADGGFLVPETLRSQLLEVALEMAVVRPRATVVPMETARVPFPMIDSTTNAGSVFGGMIAYWGEESAALVESSPKFGRTMLDTKKLTGLAVVPNELLSDSLISFAALIERLWPQAIAFFEDVAFMAGSGVGEPLGFLGAANPASVAVPAEIGQATATIVIENIIKMYSRMLPASLRTAVWLVSPETIPELYTMAISVGTGGAPVMLVNAAGPGPATMLGLPIVVTEKAARLGTRSDVSLVDLSYYLVGDRQLMTAASSTDYKFGNDQTTYRIIQRVDGRPWLQNPITPQNGGPALSPFVEIATRP